MVQHTCVKHDATESRAHDRVTSRACLCNSCRFFSRPCRNTLIAEILVQVNFYLRQLEQRQEPVSPQLLSAQTKNRRLAHLNRLIEEGGAFDSLES